MQQQIEVLKIEVGAEIYARVSTAPTDEDQMKYCQYLAETIVDLMAEKAQNEGVKK